MPLRILFADDSVTAQNMGKKILTEAGYDVVAVSNGAAAVKKIAEQKPDIIILDLYMPGYSGLEVCEKVRASMATIRTPVLLTVGKMEPYKPEDANRVRADGVIIKPFEASDLLAIVKKFEERIGEMPATAPSAPPSATEPAVEIQVRPAETRVEHPEPPLVASVQPMVEVPDHMATASAFSDLLGADSGHSMDQFNVSTPRRVPEAQPAQGPAVAATLPDYDVPRAWQPEPEPVAMVPETPISSVPAASVGEQIQEVAPARPRLIPVFQETPKYDLVPTAAAHEPEVEIQREPELEESAAETTRNTVAGEREPGLMPTLHQAEGPARETGRTIVFPKAPAMPPQAEAPPEIQVAGAQPATEERAPKVHASTPAPLSEVDFEARVAAAMASYNHAPAVAGTEPDAQTSKEAEAQPLTQYQPEVAAPENHYQVAIGTPPIDAPAPAPANAGIDREEIAARVEAELPAAAAAAAGAGEGRDHHNIAQAVNRVMERVKGDLVEEILRELKSKK